MDKTFIVIPGYNEEKSIQNVILRAKKQGFDKVIVVDDGSNDNTARESEEAGGTVLRHAVNLGKGAAAKTGCDYALKKGAKTIILMDADGQHKPEDIPRILKALKGKDIVFGYRKFDKKMPFVMRFGNWFINTITMVLSGVKLKDTQCGFRAMTSNAYKKIRWEADDYSMESEMIDKAGKNNLKYSEVPIDTIYKDKFKGTTIFDGIKIVINIIRFRLLGG